MLSNGAVMCGCAAHAAKVQKLQDIIIGQNKTKKLGKCKENHDCQHMQQSAFPFQNLGNLLFTAYKCVFQGHCFIE